MGQSNVYAIPVCTSDACDIVVQTYTLNQTILCCFNQRNSIVIPKYLKILITHTRSISTIYFCINTIHKYLFSKLYKNHSCTKRIVFSSSTSKLSGISPISMQNYDGTACFVNCGRFKERITAEKTKMSGDIWDSTFT